MDLKEAIQVVKAAGYTVRKTIARQKKSLATVGPTFVAHWCDGEITRMSIHCPDTALDIKRAIRVSWAAYDSRTKGNGLARAIEKGYFERAGHVLQEYRNIGIMEHLRTG